MSRYIRSHAPGAAFFFTVNLAQRGTTTLTENIDALRRSYRAVYQETPFVTEAIVIMPDHLHAIWRLPPGDADFSTRWKRIKAGFSQAVGPGRPTRSKRRKGEVGVWQRRFWEHTIRDEGDWRAHMAYVLNNPVKHGFVTDARDWPFSSIHRDLRAGRDWRF